VKVGLLEAEWVFTGGRRFTEPFFEDTVRAFLRHPFAALFRVAAPLPPANPAVRPAGFIFHMSRCGSTLVSRMVASLPRVHIISEAPPIDDVLQAPLPHEEKMEAVRRIVHALGQETDYFVKFDAWHIHSLALIREAFPDTPWIFVYRDPIEVLVSHLRIPGRQTIAGAMDPAILGLTEKEAAELTRTQWCARVLANFCHRALEFREDPNGLFINYRELPEAVTGSIAGHFKLSLQPGDESLMRDAARLDAKNPSFPFESDTQKKQETGKQLQLDAAVIALNALYRELEHSCATA
ncbi:MAG: Aspartyl/Asparaginyl beta-hydroxylase, partial [Bryobacterales bacterium]|nr:Aspartyl/Asparaginyl beta-hydroxylase [Bryobacterales bacterium]